MNTVKFETKQDYIDYCKENDVFNEHRTYGSTYTNFENSISSTMSFGSKYISQEPKSYPCILVYGEFNDEYYGAFVYPNDFN